MPASRSPGIDNSCLSAQPARLRAIGRATTAAVSSYSAFDLALSPRCFRVVQATRIFAAAQIGTAITREVAANVADALSKENARERSASGRDNEEGECADDNPLRVAVRVARSLACGHVPSRIALTSAVIELGRYLQSEPTLSTEIRRLQGDVLAGRPLGGDDAAEGDVTLGDREGTASACEATDFQSREDGMSREPINVQTNMEYAS